ncbi:daple-like protein [Cocos nucifera]|nr:daple-like protein [Cocos nucifera]
MALSPRLPRSIQESAGSCSPSPTVRWPFANLFDSGLRDQISALKRCEQERQNLEYQIHCLDFRIERFDERLERLRNEANLSTDKLTKCIAKKKKMEQEKTGLENKEKGLFKRYNKLKTVHGYQNLQIACLTSQIETLQTKNESISSNLQRAYQKVKELHEENKVLQKVAEDSNRLLPIKKRSNTSSADDRRYSTGASDNVRIIPDTMFLKSS